MNATLTLDEAGRVVIPQEVRDALHLDTGDTLILESEGENIVLRPMHVAGKMTQEGGVWVFRTGRRLPANVPEETLDRIRKEHESPLRDEQSRGRSSILRS